MTIEDLKKKAFKNPQSLSKKEWNAIFSDMGFIMQETGAVPQKKQPQKDPGFWK